ncbi:hypothetical protein PoB_001381500 [Plakobranchus ocellatus]|uniref:Uncharacterized protein n=1 Tax=Plakobranchus ocellatus TaxID=259542 RepID=A0AAV3YXZ6_9GAST|nr:hypothetical protein PoB_001381500 [Plakobranchus ocellatus]
MNTPFPTCSPLTFKYPQRGKEAGAVKRAETEMPCQPPLISPRNQGMGPTMPLGMEQCPYASSAERLTQAQGSAGRFG